jgi:hypothetical protein
VVLHAAPATDCFRQFHAALKAAVAANAGQARPVVYVLRPHLPLKACKVRGALGQPAVGWDS